MKKTFFLVVSFLILISCNQNDSIRSVDSKKLDEIFSNPKLNTVFNEKYNIVFNSNSLNNNELDYLKTHKLSAIIGEKFNRLRGFTIYYKSTDEKRNTKNVLESDILGFSVYEFNSDEEIVHKFYLRENDRFKNKFSLLENLMDTNNQIFLTSLYLPSLFQNTTIGINNFVDIEEVFSNNKKNQRNEFNLFKVVKIHELKEIAEKTNAPFRVVAPAECKSCAETAGNTCDAGLYCSKETPICEKEDEKQDMINRQMITQSSADILFNEELYYSLRDDLMSQYNIGEKYIDYYYALSAFLQSSDYSLTTLYRMMSALPELNSSLEKLLSDGNNNDIIISEQLKNDILSITNDLRSVSQNSDYQTILTELENDLILLSNKTKANLINELQ